MCAARVLGELLVNPVALPALGYLDSADREKGERRMENGCSFDPEHAAHRTETWFEVMTGGCRGVAIAATTSENRPIGRGRNPPKHS
jgi:hypothetical protein